ncbi:MAG: SprB repeat-containing protein, partial [Myxococcales bacterium]|nr:SprB repeat-containing protein [Myxococcales bacterium]
IVTNPPCNGAASIEIILDTASSPAQFSIDGGITFTSDSFFNNLAPGVYDIVVGGGGSCDTSYQITINATAPSIIIDSIITTDLSCNNSSDGTITVYAQGGSGTLTYSVDSGVTYQAGNQFNNLDSGYYNIFVQDGLLCTTDSFATLNAPDAINISLVSNDSLDCYGDTDGIISVTASGGAGGYTYSIDNIIFGTDTFFTNLSQGTYTVYVQDANMCIDSLQNILVEQPDSLFITNITVQNVACFGDTDGSLISFDAQGGTAPYQYAINGTYGTNNVFQNIAAGNYQLNITDANGCTATSIDTVITEPTLLEFILDSTQNATCGLNNGSIYVSGSGGTSPYFYAINGGTNQTTGTFQNLASGNYTITITDAYGCDTAEIITLNGYPAVDISLVNVDSTSCFGLSDGLIEVQGLNGTTPYQFSIDSGITYQSSGLFNNLQGRNYVLLVQDSVGCTDTLYQTVEQPQSLGLTAVVDSITCYGVADGIITLSNTGGNPAYTYSITNDAALQANNIFNNLDVGLYTAYVVDAKNCRDSVDVNVYQPDSLSFTNIDVADILCNGDDNGSFTVTVAGGTPAYQYSIDNTTFQSSNVLSGLDGGTYTIYVRDANNCIKSTTNNIFEPTVLTLDTLSTTNITCNNGNDGMIVLSAGGGTTPYEYSIDGTNFQSNATFSSLNAGNYTLSVRDANQCTETINVTLTEPQPLVVVIDSVNILCFGDTDGSITVTSVTGETAPYNISFNGGAYQAYTTGMTFNNLSAGSYNISIQDANNCPSPAFNRDVNITIPSLFEIDTVITTDPLCFGDANGDITIYTNGGGVAPYSYNIVEGGNTYTNTTGVFDNLSEGDYAIWVSDANGCTSQTVDTLVSPPELFLNVDSVINPSCFGYDNGSILMNASGGIPAQGSTPYIYTLADGTQAINNIFTSLPEGIYTVTATDGNNCSTTIQVAVEDPSPVFVSITPEDTLIEMGETVNLNVNIDSAVGTNFIYVWNPSNGLSCTDC